jgi:hypothetical protein
MMIFLGMGIPPLGWCVLGIFCPGFSVSCTTRRFAAGGYVFFYSRREAAGEFFYFRRFAAGKSVIGFPRLSGGGVFYWSRSIG